MSYPAPTIWKTGDRRRHSAKLDSANPPPSSLASATVATVATAAATTAAAREERPGFDPTDAVTSGKPASLNSELVDALTPSTAPSSPASSSSRPAPPPERQLSPPPQYLASETSDASPSSFRPGPPPFSSLVAAPAPFVIPGGRDSDSDDGDDPSSLELFESAAAPAYAPLASGSSDPSGSCSFQDETKRSLPRDSKREGEPSRSSKDADDSEPPPAYEEGFSPLQSFSYLMAAAGGASSIITQVQQGGPPINSIGDVGADETITMDLRGTRFMLSRDELLTLPEFVLLSLFPNGLFPEGHMGGFADGDAVQVDYDPASLQYMLDFFRNVAQTIPTDSSPSASQDGEMVPIEPMSAGRDDSSKRAGIIVLREDLDFYAIPPRADIKQPDMIEVKRAAARALLKQDGIFSGLKRSDEPGTTEAHLIEMLTAGGFDHDDIWGHRAGEPNKAVICSLALARLRSDIRGNDMGNNAVGMAQKLLLFWRKPARRCWWEGVELDNVEGVEGKLKVWIRRVWTLEMSVIGLR
ncbi:general stress response protein Whi2 [Gaeumannomyces tritici R3-111a-1]|uniref:General stress response protein Whi2 n=1 Tax=Gaeumannomyces tritici (strain R3-111a-1) TaxID=644352 RepID=J3NFM3_GAET3|nr:general stress response protein Whi2 [Gaeumannomyces tritici R3-111a-1]EJT80063.1 general stress response protein Whi2 [Gaeumannomyces tritici R3-111a-1]